MTSQSGVTGDDTPAALAGPPATVGFLPSQPDRAGAESLLVRSVATAGVVGIGTAIGALLSTQNIAGWIVALVVSLVTVLLAAVLWRSRRL
jgi:hypothetical protein